MTDPGEVQAADLMGHPSLRLALAGRILEREGCASGVGGQVSERHPSGSGFHAAAFEHFDRIDPARVAHLDWDLTVTAGSIRLAPALRSHVLIYQRRPEVNAIIHLHSDHVAALSATGRELGMYHVSAVLFHGEQVVHEDDGTAPHSAVVETLASNRLALMKNHGALIASESLENAVVEAITLEACARIQLLSEPNGATEIAPLEVEAGRRNFRPHHLTNTWASCADRAVDEWTGLDRALVGPGPA